MKNLKTSKIILTLMVVLAVVLGLTINSMAADEVETIDPIEGGIVSENDVNTNTPSTNTPNVNTSKNVNTPKTNTQNVNNTNNLPSTGLADYTAVYAVAGVLAVIAIVAYKKVNDYKDI